MRQIGWIEDRGGFLAHRSPLTERDETEIRAGEKTGDWTLCTPKKVENVTIRDLASAGPERVSSWSAMQLDMNRLAHAASLLATDVSPKL
jgi:hypothetical protein